MAQRAAPPSSFDGVLEAAIYADDLDAARAFYGGVLGLEEVTAVKGRHVFFRCGGTMILIFNPRETGKQPHDPAMPVPPHGAIGAGHICLTSSTKALSAWAAHLANLNVEIEADFTWPNGARSVYFRDPAGNSLELAEPKLWGLDQERKQ